jgi:hypothetical protein
MAATVLCLFLFTGVAAAFYDGHVYIHGTVQSIGANTITISDVNYRIDQKCNVVIQYKENGSFHERPGRRSDVGTGDIVTAKMTGAVLYEIMIERWRR